jgi:hemerythrin-like domain-containing protein
MTPQTGEPTPPLKRHPTLQPLSREHMNGLIHARNLQRAADEGADARLQASKSFLEAWETEILHHFDDEERLLIPLTTDPVLRDRLLKEHHDLRRMAERCRHETQRGHPTAEHLRLLGRSLHDHIRWEERDFFEHVQQQAANRLDAMTDESKEIEALRPNSRTKQALNADRPERKL